MQYLKITKYNNWLERLQVMNAGIECMYWVQWKVLKLLTLAKYLGFWLLLVIFVIDIFEILNRGIINERI